MRCFPSTSSHLRPLRKSEFCSFRSNEMKVARHFSAGKLEEEASIS